MSPDISKFQIDYYPAANIMPPHRIYSTNKFGQKVNIELPVNVQSRPDRSFNFIKSGKGMEFGHYEFYVPNDALLSPSIVVARNPDFPDQRVIGPRDTVKEIMFSYFLLDKFYPNNQFRNMDIIVGSLRPSRRVSKNGYFIREDGAYFSSSLFEMTGISNVLKDTRYRKPKPENANIGIYCDIKYPVFFVAEQPNSFAYNAIYHAHAIVHDWTHVVQSRIHNYPTNSRAIEIQAITNGHSFTAAILRSPFFSSLKNRDQYLIHCLLKRGDKYIKSYLSGGSGHRTQSAFQDTDSDNHNLPLNLYQYGKRIVFNA